MVLLLRLQDLQMPTAQTKLNGLAIFIKEGSDSADQGFVQTSEIANLGSDNVTFAQFTGLGQITAGNGLTKTGNQLDVAVGAGIEIVSDEVRVKTRCWCRCRTITVLNVSVDDSSLEINGSNELQVKANGITSSMIGSNQVTGSEIAALTVSTANLADNAVYFC